MIINYLLIFNSNNISIIESRPPSNLMRQVKRLLFMAQISFKGKYITAMLPLKKWPL